MVPSSNNALSASSGCKEWKGAVQWPVDAAISFAMTAVVATAHMACASMGLVEEEGLSEGYSQGHSGEEAVAADNAKLFYYPL